MTVKPLRGKKRRRSGDDNIADSHSCLWQLWHRSNNKNCLHIWVDKVGGILPNFWRRKVLPMIRFSIAIGLAISSLAIGKLNAKPLPYEKCPKQASVDRKGSVIKTSKDALAIAKTYATSIYGVEKANIFEPRQAKMISRDVWDVYGFTVGGLGRMMIKIDARNGCLIASVIQG